MNLVAIKQTNNKGTIEKPLLMMLFRSGVQNSNKYVLKGYSKNGGKYSYAATGAEYEISEQSSDSSHAFAFTFKQILFLQ